MNPIKYLLQGGLICGTIFVAANTSVIAADVDHSRYFKSSTALAAIASAVSILEPCDKPIEFSENVETEAVTLTATCPASEGDAISVNISFQMDESGTLFPDSFDYGN